MSVKDYGVKVTRDTENMLVTFQLIKKADESVLQTLTIYWDDVHEDVISFIELYGLTKILQDRCSSSDVLDKLDDYKALFEETLAIGKLERERKSGSGPTVKPEIEALASYKDISVAQAQKLLRQYDKDEQATILASKPVQDELAKLKAKQGEADDLDDLLS